MERAMVDLPQPGGPDQGQRFAGLEGEGDVAGGMDDAAPSAAAGGVDGVELFDFEQGAGFPRFERRARGFAVEVGRGFDQGAGVGRGGFGEDSERVALFDGSAVAEDDQVVGDARDGGEVVGDHDGGEAALFAEALDEREQQQLGGRVERAGGFVEDQQSGPVGDGAREGEALLLAAGELVGEAPEEGGIGGQPGEFEQAFDGVGVAEAAFADQIADAHRGGERCRGVLGQVGDFGAAEAAELASGQVEEGSAAEFDAAGFALHAGAEEAEHGEAERGFAGAGFADQREHAPGLEFERGVAENLAAAVGADAERADGDQGGHAETRRAKRSARRLAGTVSRRIMREGAMAAQGLRAAPSMLAAIIEPQSTAGGGGEKPRKPAAATR